MARIVGMSYKDWFCKLFGVDSVEELVGRSISVIEHIHADNKYSQKKIGESVTYSTIASVEYFDYPEEDGLVLKLLSGFEFICFVPFLSSSPFLYPNLEYVNYFGKKSFLFRKQKNYKRIIKIEINKISY